MFTSKSFWLAMAVTFLFLSVGFALLHYRLVEYGMAFFLLLPFATGISVGALPNQRMSQWGMYAILLFIIAALLALGLEGGVCILMAMCILLPCLLLGIVAGRLLVKLFKGKGTTNIKVLSAPFLLFAFSAPVESHLTKEPAVAESSTSITLPYSPEQVFEAIKSVDTLDVPKSSLMYIGLPIPYKCVLEKEAVGAQRTCYFNGGIINEKVVVFEKGKELRMVVTDYQLTGRKWLGFRDAIYLFASLPNGHTKLTRITTYTSELQPRAYWQPLEEMGIQQEHDYVFRNLQKDLQEKHIIRQVKK